MASTNVIDALNNQIQKEFFSEYFYISMEAYFAEIGLDGFAHFFNLQAKEERDHAYKFFDYVNRIGGKVILQPLGQPQVDFESPLAVFELALKHEIFITKSIHEILDIALSEKDHTTVSFLNWFVDEQSEEEDSMNKVINKLKLLKDNPSGLFMLDQELAKRTYTSPSETV